MHKSGFSKLSIWTFWSPLKFALTTTLLLIVTMLIYGLGLNIIGIKTVPPLTHLSALSCIVFIIGAALQIRALPHDKITQRSFIEIQNAQTVLTSRFFVFSWVLLIKFQHAIILHTISLSQTHPLLTIFLFLIFLLFYMYMIGILIANIYAKISRMHTMNIPMWKVCLSIPFGFTALWVPGYILHDTDKKSSTSISQSKWYTSMTNWIVARPTRTAVAFTIMTLCWLYSGTKPVLLTFIFALICGIWAIQTTPKKFIKNIGSKYSTFAVIVNWAIILTLALYSTTVSHTTQNVEININETHEIITQ